MNIFHSFLSKVRDSLAATVHHRLYYDQRVQALTEYALHSSKTGIADSDAVQPQIIVSLTSHGNRLYEVYLAIESIMGGSVLPNRIILWLSSELADIPLPLVLRNQQKRGLEIRFTNDVGPYTKLLPALEEFPDAIIITVDDDILYPYDTLEMLLNAHAQSPNCICSNRILDVEVDGSNQPTHPSTWPELTDKSRISKKNFFEGVGGVLYPPHCFGEEVFDESLYQKLCPTADDIWFNVMALLNNTSVIGANSHYSRFPLVVNQSIQDSALWHVNSSNYGQNNEMQLKAALRYFHLSYA